MIVHDKAKAGQKERWRVSVCYKDSQGVNRRKWAIAHSLKEAKEKEALLTIQLKTPSDFEKMTVDDLFQRYIEFSKKNKKKLTVDSIRNDYLLIKDVLGPLDVRKLTVHDFEKWKDSLDEKGLKLSTKNTVYSQLHAMLKYASVHYGINTVNILERVGSFKKDRNVLDDEEEEGKLKCWTEEQFEAFLKAYDEAYKELFESGKKPRGRPSMIAWKCTKTLCCVCFYAGLRRGEANALYISDFHDDKGRPWLNVNKSAELSNTNNANGGRKTEWIVSTTKNESSTRKVPIPEKLATILRKHVTDYSSKVPLLPSNGRGKGKKEERYLIGGFNPVPHSSMAYVFKGVVAKAGLPEITIHGLRHSFVSVLINNQVPLETISRLVGHSTPAMTWKVYSHLYPETLSNAVDVFDKKPIKEANQ